MKQPLFEWYVVKCDSKNIYQEDMYSKDIGLRAQKHDNYSRLSNQQIWEHRYDHFVSMRIFTSIMDKKFMRAPKIMRTQFGVANHVVLIACFIS